MTNYEARQAIRFRAEMARYMQQLFDLGESEQLRKLQEEYPYSWREFQIRQRKPSAKELQHIVQSDEVRHIFNTHNFEITLEEDITNTKVTIKNQDREWLNYKLRDREFDGPTWFPTRLTDWNYSHPDDTFALGPAVEQSRYWGNPETPLIKVFSEVETEFIINPFCQLPFDKPTEENLQWWLTQWRKVVNNPSTPFPGQFSLTNIPGLTRHVFEETQSLLRKKGYEYLTSVPTWLYVATLNTHFGFEYMYPEDEQKVSAILARLPYGTIEERKRASWITVLQFWAELAERQGVDPESLIGENLILRDNTGEILTYPLTPERNLWQIYQL